MAGAAEWVVFSLDAGRYALPLAAVDRIVRAVEVTHLPTAPPIVRGAIDVQGRVLPVFDLRRRFGLPERDIDPADQFVIARSANRTVVLVVDTAQGVVQSPLSDTTSAASIASGLEHIRGVIRLPDGLVLIQDLDLFLSAAESRALDEALERGAAHGG
ncbi:MAG TPA: chemotaxis protein CheW [Steroidobacteraceae bacterium]|nr:chemotaxis protein CheW [Steroidobacteraceae bacterium]